MDSNIQNQLEQTLQSDNRVWVNNDCKETRILAKNILLDLVEKTDPTIIGLLLGNNELKRHFFVEVNGILVFKLQDFRFFLDKHSINNSYTKYANRIGLTDGKRFLKDSSDIVLDFPFKDCVLNGGQSTEEGEEIYFKRNNSQTASQPASQLYTKLTRKRQEIFFNQTLAFDEIDRLFDAKAFSKFSRHTADGKQAVGEIKRRSDGTPAENLIIKGNNLIVLHSLATQFKGKVKLIYIDPPYYFRKKKKDDSFGYNSNFKLSTWLTFMKNRLEIAKQLMTEDGLIFVSIDEDGQAYLRILMDEIFGRENYITDLIRKTKSSTNDANTGANVQHENCLIFALQKENTDVLGGEKDLSSYSNPDNDPNGDWKSSDPSAKSGKQENNWFAVENPYTGQIDYPPQGRFWLFSKNSIKKHLENGTIVFKKEIKEGERGFIYKKYKNKLKTQLKTLNSLIATDNTCMNQVGTKELSELDLQDDLKNPKPENFIKLIIEHATNENDIILDYHLGSGTTAAVAHKMNRQYIGIEQMDYIETLAVERLKKVIDGEQGGISKAVNWQGGGEFVYAELAPFNETAKRQILACESAGCLKALFEDLCEHYFLKYNVGVNEFSQIINEPEFQSLPLDEQKQMVLEMLDLNQMYVSLSEMDDAQFAGCLNDDNKALSRAFYQAEKKDGE